MINFKDIIKKITKRLFNRRIIYENYHKVKYTCFYDNHIKINICINGILYNVLVSKKQYKEYVKHIKIKYSTVKHNPTKLDITYAEGYLNIYNRTATYPSKRRKKYYCYERSY